MAWASFCDFYRDGENFGGQLSAKDRDYHRLYPPDRFRAQSMGHNFGPACWFLDEFHPAGVGKRDGTGWESFEPVYHLFGLVLLHDSTYWMSWAAPDSYQPYVRALRSCNWGDQYRMIPYWSQQIVKLPEHQFATFYVDDKARRILLIFLNNGEEPGTFDHALDWKALGAGTWGALKARSVHPVPTRTRDGKTEVLLDEWEKQWRAGGTAQVRDGRLSFPYAAACSRLVEIAAEAKP